MGKLFQRETIQNNRLRVVVERKRKKPSWMNRERKKELRCDENKKKMVKL